MTTLLTQMQGADARYHVRHNKEWGVTHPLLGIDTFPELQRIEGKIMVVHMDENYATNKHNIGLLYLVCL